MEWESKLSFDPLHNVTVILSNYHFIVKFAADNSNKGEYSNVKQKTDTSMTNSAVSQPNFETSNNHQQQQQPNDFQAGEFIVSRQDMFQDWPPIWRVDSKTLLQKFEPFHSNNKTIYRSLSTVSVCMCARMIDNFQHCAE